MTRPIKFRGRDLAGKMRFGHYATTSGYPYIIDDGVWYEVEPDSVNQFVGYDKDGREVYEGDKLVSVDNGAVWVAVLNPTVTLPKYEHLESSNLELSGLKLQENQS